jgi:hypothetical protein
MTTFQYSADNEKTNDKRLENKTEPNTDNDKTK